VQADAGTTNGSTVVVVVVVAHVPHAAGHMSFTVLPGTPTMLIDISASHVQTPATAVLQDVSSPPESVVTTVPKVSSQELRKHAK